MENQDTGKLKEREEMWSRWERKQRRGKVMGGILIAGIGALFLARELGAELPFWLFTWKMLLIGIGVVFAVKHKFMHPAWIILVGVGGLFLMNDFYPEMNLRPFMLPIVLIAVGLFIIFKPRRRFEDRFRRHWQKAHYEHRKRWENWQEHEVSSSSSDDKIESTAFFAGVKKNILSKNFKGGEVTNIFGGTQLNLLQADLAPDAKLEITQALGGTQLLVPANWEIRSELVTVMGSVEDKRISVPGAPGESGKLLILTGTTFMGGIEIKSA